MSSASTNHFRKRSILFPSIFPPFITINMVLTVGGLLGAGLHKMLGRLFDIVFGGSLTKHTEYYLKLIKLYSVRRVLDADRFKSAVAILAITEALDGKVSRSLIEQMQQSVVSQVPATVESTDSKGGEVELSQLMEFMKGYADFHVKLTTAERMKAGQVENIQSPSPSTQH